MQDQFSLKRHNTSSNNCIQTVLTKPFTASLGFQHRFCTRFGIKSKALSGEKLSADVVSADEFLPEFDKLTEGYSLHQIFNCDETGLYYKMLPQRTLTSMHTEPSGTKKPRERVTINACANASGSIKLPLQMIGRAKTPRCFRGIDKDKLPVIYTNQNNAWMDVGIFRDWFQNVFVPEVRKQLADLGQEKKAILFLDNCSAHPGEDVLVSDDRKIIAKFFPPNVTSLIQPMDQGILECLKRKYRKAILKRILCEEDEDANIIHILKKIDLLQVCRHISESWDQIATSTLQNAWNKLLQRKEQPSDNVATEDIDNDDFVRELSLLNINVTSDDVQEWFHADGPGYEHLDDQSIIALAEKDEEEDIEEEEEYESPEVEVVTPEVSHTQAVEHFDKVLVYLKSLPDATPLSISFIIGLREQAAERRKASLKQTKISSFFTNNNA